MYSASDCLLAEFEYSRNMRSAIYGAGSLGTILGAYITKNGGQIDLINHNKAHVAALRAEGAREGGSRTYAFRKYHKIANH